MQGQFGESPPEDEGVDSLKRRSRPEPNCCVAKMSTNHVIHPLPRILIVDDGPEFRKMLSTFFQRAGFVTDEAATGKEGLKRSERRAAELKSLIFGRHLPFASASARVPCSNFPPAYHPPFPKPFTDKGLRPPFPQ